MTSPKSHYLTQKFTARRGSQALQSLPSQQRASILNTLASLLEERETEILIANQRDLDAATELAGPLRSDFLFLLIDYLLLLMVFDNLQVRKWSVNNSNLFSGYCSFPSESIVSHDIVGEEIDRVRMGVGLELVKRKVPLGVILVVFESRPDCLPQVRSLYNQQPLYDNIIYMC